MFLSRLHRLCTAGEGLARAERRQRLHDTKCFVCACSRCVAEAAAEGVAAEQAAVVKAAAVAETR